MTILPQPPGSFDFFGLNLTGYLAQPGSAFTVNRYGFDTGRRRFIVNTDIANLGDFILGAPDFEFPLMFVHKVTQEEIGSVWTVCDVEYLGQIFPNKPHQFDIDADTRKTSVTFVIGLTIINWAIELSEVTVQDTYLTATAPDFNQSGSVFNGILGASGVGGLTPPIQLPDPDVSSIGIAIGWPGSIRIYRWWWVLRRRAVRIAGTPLTTTGKRVLSGSSNVTACTANLVGTNTKYTTELSAGNKIFAVNPPVYNPAFPPTYVYNVIATAFAAGFTVNSITNDGHAILTHDAFPCVVPYYTFVGGFYTFAALPNVQNGIVVPSAPVLYEVTDSWKRVVTLIGEPLVNAAGS